MPVDILFSVKNLDVLTFLQKEDPVALIHCFR